MVYSRNEDVVYIYNSWASCSSNVWSIWHFVFS